MIEMMFNNLTIYQLIGYLLLTIFILGFVLWLIIFIGYGNYLKKQQMKNDKKSE